MQLTSPKRHSTNRASGKVGAVHVAQNDRSVQFVNAESSDNLTADSYGRFTQDYINRSGNTYTINAILANDDRILGYNATSSHWTGTKGPSFTYDSTNNVKTISSSIFTGSATITWNRDGLPVQVLFPNGLTATSEFTSAHAATSVQYSTGIAPTVLVQRDSLGRVANRTPGLFADSVSSYGYNPDGTLAWWGLSGRVNTPCTFDSSYGWQCVHTEGVRETNYSYDPAGIRRLAAHPTVPMDCCRRMATRWGTTKTAISSRKAVRAFRRP